MNDSVFVDTSAWLALANKKDIWHEKARIIRDELIARKCKFFVTDYIIIEVGNSLSRASFYKTAVNLIDSIILSSSVEIIWIDMGLFQHGWRYFKKYEDKDWSLTDCTSFYIMNQYNIKLAFTNDHHFEQAGFTRLLK